MIIAVPEARMDWASPMGRESDKYRVQIVWWYFACTTCGKTAKDVPAASSHALGALEQGDVHEEKYQCRDGQLALFRVAA
jgi:hypothetical protein